MQQLTNLELISSLIICVFAMLIRVAAMMSKLEGKAKVSRWSVVYHFSASLGIGFLTVLLLRDHTTLGSGTKMGITFAASFCATVIVDAFLLIKPQQILNAFAKWVAAKTGTTTDENDSENIG